MTGTATVTANEPAHAWVTTSTVTHDSFHCSDEQTQRFNEYGLGRNPLSAERLEQRREQAAQRHRFIHEHGAGHLVGGESMVHDNGLTRWRRKVWRVAVDSVYGPALYDYQWNTGEHWARSGGRPKVIRNVDRWDEYVARADRLTAWKQNPELLCAPEGTLEQFKLVYEARGRYNRDWFGPIDIAVMDNGTARPTVCTRCLDDIDVPGWTDFRRGPRCEQCFWDRQHYYEKRAMFGTGQHRAAFDQEMKCRGCDQWFRVVGAARRDRKYCSADCAHTADLERRKQRRIADRPARNCQAPGCHHVIDPTKRSDVKTCSARCRQALRRAVTADVLETPGEQGIAVTGDGGAR